MRAPLSCVVLVVAACGGTLPATDIDAATDTAIDTAVEPGWTSLIERSWSINANYDVHKCRVIRVPQDMYITGFRLIAPTGTHHTVLTSPTTAAVGDSDCTPTIDPEMLYGGGINSNDALLPPGVAVKLTAGQYLRLTLHLYNASDAALGGTSGIQVKTIDAAEVTSEADMIFLGNISNWSIPPTSMAYNIYGSCSAPATWHLFTLWPHMHGAATHQTVSVRHGNNVVKTLLDQPYNVNEQRVYVMADTVIDPNDELQVTCTYVNNTGFDIPSGDASSAEMCLTGLLKYPKGGSQYQCASL